LHQPHRPIAQAARDQHEGKSEAISKKQNIAGKARPKLCLKLKIIIRRICEIVCAQDFAFMPRQGLSNHAELLTKVASV